jgi:dihydroxyacetone kinase-like protein
MLDALLPACDALDAAVEAGAAWPTAWRRLLRRPATGRDATTPDAGAQGPGQLPRRAQRGAPGPGRDVSALLLQAAESALPGGS